MNLDEYRYSTAELAAEFGRAPKTIRKRAAALGIGIDWEGRVGFRYSEADRQRLIESLRPVQDPKPRRRKRRAA